MFYCLRNSKKPNEKKVSLNRKINEITLERKREKKGDKDYYSDKKVRIKWSSPDCVVEQCEAIKI